MCLFFFLGGGFYLEHEKGVKDSLRNRAREFVDLDLSREHHPIRRFYSFVICLWQFHELVESSLAVARCSVSRAAPGPGRSGTAPRSMTRIRHGRSGIGDV